MKKYATIPVIAAFLLAAATTPASGHFNKTDVTGTCPQLSSSSHNGGAVLAALVPSWSRDDDKCLRVRIKVNGKGLNGLSGWSTQTYYGDPGRLVQDWAEDIGWTKHDVQVASGTWWGITLNH